MTKMERGGREEREKRGGKERGGGGEDDVISLAQKYLVSTKSKDLKHS